MPIKINTEINLSVILSALALLVGGITAFFNLKGDVKVHTAQIAQLTKEGDELRIKHMAMINRTSQVEQVAQTATARSFTNTKQLIALQKNQEVRAMTLPTEKTKDK